MKQLLKIYCDGGARGNPGPAASAFVVYENKKIIHQDYRTIGKATNNVAEYKAVLMALSWLTKNKKVGSVLFILDSELVVKQLKGLYKIKSDNLKPLATKAKSLEKEYGGEINYKAVRRNKNTISDSLVNKALDETTK